MSLNKVNYVDGQTIISAQNMNNIQDEIIRLGEKEAVQSDWNQNDETALDFIKNRTHGIDWQESEIFNGVFENDDGMWMFMAEGATLPLLNPGEKYQIIIEDEVFESILLDKAKMEELSEEIELPQDVKAYFLGNPSTLIPSVNSNGEVFSLVFIEMKNEGVVGLLVLLEEIPRESDNYRVKVSGQFGSAVKKLDEIYMPESYNELSELAISFPDLNERLNSAERVLNNQFYKLNSLENTLSETIKHTTQSLTDTQKARARKNIGAISVDEVPSQPLPSHLPEEAIVEPSDISPRLEIEIPNNWSPSFLGGYITVVEDEEFYNMVMTDKTLFYSFDNTNYSKLYPFNFEGTYALAPNPTNMFESFYIAPLKSNGIKGVYIKAREKINKLFLNIAHYRLDFCSRLMSADTIPPTIARLTDITNALENLITLEDIDFICAERVKVTFPVHGLSIKISYTDAKGVFHKNENLPEKSKTTYEVLKGTSITLNGNYFDATSFVLPEDSKYYTKVSDSEIIPLMDFEIKYADGAPM